eukprot:GFYU01027885.1.p2 GENE.GFYU01027885.1~~GFYU01027885.1.p2  ORF type:complete len:196 (+),score=83.73 GFYU01027885.1:51-590(+)
MGRIGWVDALARQATRDVKTFEELLLEPIQSDLNKHTYMYERYQCEGLPTHNDHYIEYPEIVVMMLREVKYGIDLGFNRVTVNPLLNDDDAQAGFNYHVGNVHVDYSPKEVNIRSPAHGNKEFYLTGLQANTAFTITVQDHNTNALTAAPAVATSDANGVLQFKSNCGPDLVVTAAIAA